GQDAPVGAPLAVITAPDETLTNEQITALIHEYTENQKRQAELAKGKHTATTAPRTTVRPPVARRPGERINASPAARRLAQERDIDLSTLSGTGPGGLIGREDVLRAAEELAAASPLEAEELDIDVDGIKTHYLIAGPIHAPRVVFVHGLGGSLTTWSLNLPTFAEKYRVCALDLVGAGNSDKPVADYSIPTLATFLARFLAKLGPEWRHINLVGHSLGGAIALAYADRYPHQVEHLILIDSAGLGHEMNRMVLELIRSTPDLEKLRAELTYFFSRPDFVQQPLIDQLYLQRTQPGAYDALIATTNATFDEGWQLIDLRSILEKLKIPTLLVWGESDVVVPIAHAHEMKQTTSHHLETIPECGHCPHIEKAAEFNRLAMNFLAK
ncbi:MAG TPA: alpha/beta fold hydrolase, partial [Ktedonobacteraceae bacterium]|nr:alpha/beta fold hydrolase [Ktedonobacteraceae bacterium]